MRGTLISTPPISLLITSVFRVLLVEYIAAVNPAGPPPIIITSCIKTPYCLLFLELKIYQSEKENNSDGNKTKTSCET
jgi:hypothetical protein